VVKAQCERCKEIVQLAFSIEGGATIRVRCPSCAAEYRVEASVEGAAAPPPLAPARTSGSSAAVPEFTCPKCGEPQKRSAACPRCGLIFSKWNPVAAASAPGGDVGAAAALFAACEADWDDPARHDAFLAHCTEAGAWAYAATAYRRQTTVPERRAIAVERLDKVRERAEKALAIAPRMQREKSTKNPLKSAAVLAVVVALFIAGIWFIGGRLSSRPSTVHSRPSGSGSGSGL